MKHASRFLFGAVLGVALGYALMLLVRPAAPRVRPQRRPPEDIRERELVS